MIEVFQTFGALYQYESAAPGICCFSGVLGSLSKIKVFGLKRVVRMITSSSATNNQIENQSFGFGKGGKKVLT